jgi:hypothetical protein
MRVPKLLLTEYFRLQLEPIGDGPSLITVGVKPDGFQDRATNDVVVTPEASYTVLYGKLSNFVVTLRG